MRKTGWSIVLEEILQRFCSAEDTTRISAVEWDRKCRAHPGGWGCGRSSCGPAKRSPAWWGVGQRTGFVRTWWSRFSKARKRFAHWQSYDLRFEVLTCNYGKSLGCVRGFAEMMLKVSQLEVSSRTKCLSIRNTMLSPSGGGSERIHGWYSRRKKWKHTSTSL